MMLNKYPDWISAIVSGIIVGVVYLPVHAGFLIYIGLVPLIHIWLNSDIKTSVKMSFMSAITANFIAFFWMGLNMGTSPIIAFVSLIGSVLYLAIFWIINGAVITFLHQRLRIGLIIIPFSWVTMEYFRSFGPMGFPWADLALTQVYYLPLIQTVDITGTAGIAFIICIVNVLIYLSLTEKKSNPFLIGTILIITLVFGFGSWRMNSIEKQLVENDFSVAVIQPNVDPVKKWEKSFRNELVDLMDSLTVEAIKMEPDFILWPESAIPAYLRLSVRFRRPIHQRVKESGIPLLTGTVDLISDINGSHYFNGALLLKPDGSQQIYHKIILVPFAEYIPLSKKFPKLKKLNFGQGNFEHGREYTVFTVGSHRFSNMICYESSFPRLARKFVERGAEFLTIETNDGWSGNSPGAYQHFAIAQLRAVENRVPVVRSANTGISGIISPTGKVLEQMAFYERGVIFGSLSFLSGNWQTVSGDIFSLICILIGIGLVCWEWFKNREMIIGTKD